MSETKTPETLADRLCKKAFFMGAKCENQRIVRIMKEELCVEQLWYPRLIRRIEESCLEHDDYENT